MYDWKDLTFGIEVEFTGIPRIRVAFIIAEFFNSDFYHCGDFFDTYEIEDHIGRIWRVIKDNSIKAEYKDEDGKIALATDIYKVEVVSPILNYRTDISILQNLVKKIKEAGAFPNDFAGIHIHIGSEYFTPKKLRNLCNIVFAKQDILYRALQVNKIRKEQYCMMLSYDFIKNLNKEKPKTIDKFTNIWYGINDIDRRGNPSCKTTKYHISRYQLINLHNMLIGRQPTIEFRCFESTLDSEVIKAYVILSLLISTQALNTSKTSCKETITFNDKYSMRIWLIKLGAIGDEFKETRRHLLKYLSGNSAFRDKGQIESPF